MALTGLSARLCPSMRNPSGGAPMPSGACSTPRLIVSIDEKPVRRCALMLIASAPCSS